MEDAGNAADTLGDAAASNQQAGEPVLENSVVHPSDLTGSKLPSNPSGWFEFNYVVCRIRIVAN